MASRIKIVRARTTLSALVLCVGLICSLVACHGDRSESFYPSLAAADKDGAITRGWIPADLLPIHSRDIHELGEISPSIEWCGFDFPVADSDSLRKNLRAVDVPPPAVKRVPNPGVSWWPTVLTGDLDTSEIRKAGFQLYAIERPATSVTNEVLLFAIDWEKGRGFFYRTPEP
jgi:hypothetical protein